MSVPLMFGFDTLPLRTGLYAAHMKAEGFDQLDLISNVTAWQTTKINGRTWLTAQHSFYAPISSVVGRTFWLMARQLGELFGNPTPLTKGVVGLRIWVDQNFVDRYNAGAAGNNLLTINGAAVDGPLLSKFTVGEHFVEYEIDFVANTVKTYYDASLVNTYQAAGQFLFTHVLQLGMAAISQQSLATVNMLSFNDIYTTYDLQDGDISGRLGPVKVLPMVVDKSTRPANWSYADTDAMFNYFDYDQDATAGLFTGHCLIPRFTSEIDVAGQFKWDTVPLSTSPTISQRFNPAGVAGDSWPAPVAATKILANITFERAKKAAGYSLNGYSNNYGAFDDWTFEGSNDGLTWTVLDTRVGCASKIQLGTKFYAFKIDPAKQGSYRYFRWNVSKVLVAPQQAGRVYMGHFQILGDPADATLNEIYDGLTRSPNTTQTDMDYPVVRTGTDGSEGSFGFKVPDTGTSQILAVRMGVTGRRDQGSSEHMRARLKVGEAVTPERVIELKPHVERHELLPTVTKAPDGTAWTKASLESLQVVIKSKSGAK